MEGFSSSPASRRPLQCVIPLRSICCLIFLNDVLVKLQKSSQVFLLLLLFFVFPSCSSESLGVHGEPNAVSGEQACAAGSGLRAAIQVPGEVLGQGSGGKQAFASSSSYSLTFSGSS